MKSATNSRVTTSHLVKNPTSPPGRRSLVLIQSQLAKSPSQEKIVPQVANGPRLHAKHGSQGQRSFYTYSPVGKLCVGTTKQTKFLSKTFVEEKLSNLYDMSTQIVFHPQFFINSPEGKGKKEKVLQKLSGCLNSRTITGTPKTTKGKERSPTSQMSEPKMLGTSHENNRPPAIMTPGPSAYYYKTESRKASSKSIEHDAQLAFNTKSQASLTGYLPELQTSTHSKLANNSGIKETLSLTVKTAAIYTKQIQDNHLKNFLLK